MVDLRIASTFGFALVVFTLTIATVVYKGAERRDKYSGHSLLKKILGPRGENPV